ncbi:hypothetical protein SA3033_04300, partial [Aggregatibacter actinomycetemcomitans serotype d str. SA3033]
MTKLFSPTFKQQCVDLMLKQHHTIARVSKMMSISTSACSAISWLYSQYIKSAVNFNRTFPIFSSFAFYYHEVFLI